ncbi:hypothetical protein VNO77_27235 [Canavalia gladiata]|uniref:Uncharacterized protein n=1 Tax=Canavalia gladiata TaxID=3824 RepID=A0AAN9KUE8_CANGL
MGCSRITKPPRWGPSGLIYLSYVISMELTSLPPTQDDRFKGRTIEGNRVDSLNHGFAKIGRIVYELCSTRKSKVLFNLVSTPFAFNQLLVLLSLEIKHLTENHAIVKPNVYVHTTVNALVDAVTSYRFKISSLSSEQVMLQVPLVCMKGKASVPGHQPIAWSLFMFDLRISLFQLADDRSYFRDSLLPWDIMPCDVKS